MHYRTWITSLAAWGLAAGALAADPPDLTPNIWERDDDIAVRQDSGPHEGVGPSTGYVFFQAAEDLRFSFRKRVLHPGATIGYHQQDKDEVYYFLSGQGRMTVDDHEFDVGPGDAVLTRVDRWHGLEQTGDTDLVLIVVFEKR